ncbi:hypothetical protein A2U01_0053917 [Trifolium medium]|uniref:Uncharacterized protein n=1 Tax=Trifolium medium TaxID=97028 RepID=A0A392R7W8_9FABA|nr:hypothetical protein [Trifolium medium]
MSSFLSSKSKIERCPAFSPASPLNNPYEGHFEAPFPAESPERASPPH